MTSAANREYLLVDEVYEAIDKSLPGVSNSEIARRVRRDESDIRRQRQRTKMHFATADHLLSSLDLTHLLYDGTLTVYEGAINGIPHEETKYDKLRQENIRLRREIRRLKGL